MDYDDIFEQLEEVNEGAEQEVEKCLEDALEHGEGYLRITKDMRISHIPFGDIFIKQ
jgi:hypothetical protein